MESTKTLFTVKAAGELNESSWKVNGLLHNGAPAEALVLCLTAAETELTGESSGGCLHQLLNSFHPNLKTAIHHVIDKKIFSGQISQVQIVPSLGYLPFGHIILLGVGDQAAHANFGRRIGPGAELHNYRIGAAGVSRLAGKQKIHSLAVWVSNASLQQTTADKLERVVGALTEGLLLGDYRIKSYQRDKVSSSKLLEVTYLIDGSAPISGIESSIKKAEIYAEATIAARDLVNMPGNLLVPAKMAEEALTIAKTYGLECTILDENEILAQGMGGLYGVGKGSSNPPRMIVLKYQGLEEWTDVLGLVGKGITFDTGGVSLKKAEGMDEMIGDMGGAAALLGIMTAVGQFRPKLNLLAVIPSAENMQSSAAYKPGDVLTTLSGRTIEVLNTDAEGRVVLSDGITYAKQLGADRLIDIATLTGAVMVCLGDVATGAVSNDETFLAQLKGAAELSGERIWELPAYPEYWDMLKSDVADLKNIGGRLAGAITGGLFIGTFADNTPWIHLDIAGTNWLQKDRGVDPKGGTGVMVRTILEHLLHSGQGS